MTIHLATARLPKARRTTVEWLEHIGLSDLELHFLKHGSKHSNLRRFNAAVEDDYQQARLFALDGQTASYLLRHPWNEKKQAVEGLTWASNWDELGKLLTLHIR
jgi:hypothetical protein